MNLLMWLETLLAKYIGCLPVTRLLHDLSNMHLFEMQKFVWIMVFQNGYTGNLLLDSFKDFWVLWTYTKIAFCVVSSQKLSPSSASLGGYSLR